MTHFAAGFKFEITRVTKQNSLYYSVFFSRWKTCRCRAVNEAVLLKSETEITIDTVDLYDLVKQELNKTK